MDRFPSDGITWTIEHVTPDMAREWLGVNFSNRTLEHDDVNRYARDMKAGNWRITGEAVKFSWDGNLRDGQHRLHGVIRAGVTVPMPVIRGLDPDAQVNMDSGRKRTVGNALTMQGERWATNLAALASMILRDYYSLRKPTVDEQLKLIESDPGIRAIVQEIVPSLHIGYISRTWQGYLYWRLDRIDSSDAAKFFDALSSLADLPQDSPILALHHRLQHDRRTHKGSGPAARQEVTSLVFQAWNSFRKNEPRKRITIQYGVGASIFIPDPV